MEVHAGYTDDESGPNDVILRAMYDAISPERLIRSGLMSHY